jgi:hypothetical protein
MGKSERLMTWAEPTLLRGARTFTAAMLVPPRATSRARQATTNAGEGLGIMRSISNLLYWTRGS